jgi:hypothetical protein
MFFLEEKHSPASSNPTSISVTQNGAKAPVVLRVGSEACLLATKDSTLDGILLQVPLLPLRGLQAAPRRLRAPSRGATTAVFESLSREHTGRAPLPSDIKKTPLRVFF